MKIRLATKDDAAELNQLVNSAYRGDSSRSGWTTEADLLDGIRTTETALVQMIDKENAMILLAEKEGIDACVYLEKKADVLYLGMLTVKPSLQGGGLGSMLMQEAEKKALDLECRAIQMTVIALRKELIEYYKRKGFVDTGKREAFPDDPAFGIPKQPLKFMLMEKILTM